MKRRVTGIGGIFFKAQDQDRLYAWYEARLGLTRQPDGGVVFSWREARKRRETRIHRLGDLPKKHGLF